MKNHTLLLLLFFSGVAACASGQDTLFVNGPFKKEKAGPYIRYFKTEQSLTISSAAKILEHNLNEVKKLNDSHLGIGTDNFWFSLRIKNQSDEARRLMLELKQPHLTRVSFVEKSGEGFIERGTMGMLYPFADRPVKHRNFLLPIHCQPHETTQVFVLITQENSLNAPFILWDEAAFHQHDYALNLLFGILFGILIFCSVLALFCFAMVKQKMFLWYFLLRGHLLSFSVL